MRTKRGQVTIFIVLAVFVLLIAGAYFMIGTPIDTSEIPESSSQSIFSIYITGCLEQALERGIPTVSVQGGYVNPLPTAIDFLDVDTQTIRKIPVYRKNDVVSIPSLAMMGDQLSFLIGTDVLSCLEAHDFPQTLEYDPQELSMDLTIDQSSITARMKLPLSIVQQDSIEELNSFTAEQDSLLFVFHHIATLISENEHLDQRNLPLSDFKYYSNLYDLGIHYEKHTQDNKIYFLYYLEERNTSEPQLFSFAHHFSFESETSSPDDLFSIEDLTAHVGYAFTHTVQAHVPGLTFSDNSPLFDIHPDTGLITFTPAYTDSGKHLVELIAEDQTGRNQQEIITLTIDNFGYNPSIDRIGYHEVSVGEEFTFTVGASSSHSDSSYVFVDNATLFDIDKATGSIEFTPITENIGEYDFTITVIDQTYSTHSTRKGTIRVIS